jgi:peroxiredoxin
VEAYEAFGKIFSDSEDEQLSSFAEMLAGSAGRLKLVGNVLELQGTKLDGTKFDVAELKDKVVLVCFWAADCHSCRSEFPNIKKSYDKYHEHGFEVVGVSIDREREKLEAYVEEKQVPWITLHEKDNAGQNPATKRYGIFGIPTMFLVGRDGKVISIAARGNELTRLLDEQFGDVEATDGAES